jgi:hypothetical protein
MANFQDPSRSNSRAPRTTFAPFTCHVQSRGAFPFYALLRGLAYSAAPLSLPAAAGECLGARTGDNDDLVFDSLHEVLLSSLYFPLSHLLNGPLSLGSVARSLPSKKM